MKSYLYESSGSDSKSLSIEPNSENNDKLHQIKMMLLLKNNIYGDDDSQYLNLDSISNSLNNSYQNITSKKNKKSNDILDIFDDKKINDKKKDLIKKEEIIKKNEEEKISIDISAERDKNNDIDWSYDINNKNNKDEKKETKKDDKEQESKKNNIKEKDNIFDDDYYDDFEKDINAYLENKKDEKKELKKDNINIEDIKLTDKSRNLKVDEGTETEKPINENKSNDDKIPDLKIKEKKENLKDIDNKDNLDIILDNKLQQENIDKLKLNLIEEKDKKPSEELKMQKEKENEEHQRELLSKKIKEIKDINLLVNTLTEEIISKLITTEIKSPKKKLIPLKKFKFDKFDKMSTQNALNNSFGSAGNSHDHLSKEFGLGGLSQLSLQDELLSLNDSLMSNYSANSVFYKTIKDKKKEKTINLYYKEIAPRLIRLIRKEIITKYNQIYENISTPMKNNSEKLMISLALQDAELLRENYKSIDKLKSITKILDKDKLLKNFEPINKKIRNNDNVTSDNFYDKILNDCIIETAIEIINKERLYGKNGEPLKWSSRTHELAFKYRKDDPYKLADYVCEKLDFFIKRKVGLISDNYDEMSIEQINMEKDKRLTNIIQRELDENEYQWINLEMEETQLKVDNTEQIMEQLYNEVIEILEHIQYSRLNPELYQNKSIYSCEEIPKLHFQITTTEDAAGADGNDNNNSDNKNNL